MTGARAPLVVARAGVDLAVRTLPELDDRLRYRAEFLAELHVLPPVSQLRYTTGVLSQTLALRAALGSTPSRAEEDAMTITGPRTFNWRCRVLRRHHWVVRSAEDGTRYHACSRCGRDRSDADLGGGPTTGAAAGAGF
jgi:hypothetical protein